MLALSLQCRIQQLTLPRLEQALRDSLATLSWDVEISSSEESVYVALHPASGPVALSLQGTLLALEAQTGTVGAGYHAFIVSLADALLAALDAKASWKATFDPALYFTRRDFAALERAHATWLKQTASEILALAERGASGFALGLPAGLEVAHGGFLATNMGPRDQAWVERVALDGNAGRDAFAWWGSARDAVFHRGIALASIWLDVRWRKPLDARERAVLERVVKELEIAFGEDSTVEYPWHEWAEIFVLLGEDSLRATRAQMKSLGLPKESKKNPIGYRRLAVRVMLSGDWSVAIPGDFAERWEDRGTWVGWDSKRTLWVTTAEAPEGHDTEASLAGLPELEGDTDILAMSRGPIRGQVRFGTKDDESEAAKPGARSHIAHAHAAMGSHVVIGTFIGSREDEREMFLEIWGSLDHA